MATTLHIPAWRRLLPRWATATLALGLLAGCASLNSIDSEVAVYNQWPAGRKPATYAFERLPSQQAQAQKQAQLEAAARPGLEAAGFTSAPDPQSADVTVQIGVRIGRADPSPYDDPFWWRGGLYGARFHRRPFYSPFYPGSGSLFDNPRYEREAAVLIRDRASNQPLYEARASTEGNTTGSEALIQVMFRAAMADFPYAGHNSPRSVRIELPAR